MRALIAGPLTAVGGFQRNVAVFKPSPEVNLFGSGMGVRSVATAVSSGLLAVLLPPTPVVRLSYVRTQPIDVVVGQSGTFKAPVFGSTSKMLFRKIVWPALTTGAAGSGTK